jgi:hypothetical protein
MILPMREKFFRFMMANSIFTGPVDPSLARGPRFRVDGEVVRDAALAAAGLLSDKMGGPSVFPPQPDGVTQHSFGPLAWNAATGEDRYRRGVYTFWKRTTPFAALVTFDAPSREMACVRRPRSNTPLQALTLLNDVMFVEAARALAGRIMTHEANDMTARVEFAFRRCVGRRPDAFEMQRLSDLYAQQLARFEGKAADPLAVLGLKAAPEGINVNAQAAWVIVASVLLNLDETITKG